MNEELRRESEKLTRSWMRHEAAWLRDYLVATVEDPRINFQSILSRHFLARELFGSRFEALIQQEYRFAAAVNWLLGLGDTLADTEDLQSILFSLRRGADNAEGVWIPAFVSQTFNSLPAVACGLTVSNYLEGFLTTSEIFEGKIRPNQPSMNTFQNLWHATLTSDSPAAAHQPEAPSLVEPACGSANDYRFLHSYGLATRLNYTGFDLCATNVENARAMFPHVRFEIGNVFEIPAADKSYDFCLTHDLLEHLSIPGLQAAVDEICRVTRRAISIGFFQMEEIPEHVVRPVEDYHWNLLSMARIKEMFAARGFVAQIIHIGTFVREQTGCLQTYNSNAYTFLLRAA